MYDELKQKVCKANLELANQQLVVLTWGNVSQITEDRKHIVIKPSGVSYARMTPEQMVVVDAEGNLVEGSLRPSSDLMTHVELYRAFPAVGSIVHTHSTWATAFAQIQQDIPCYGTTHADLFYGNVPCTRPLTQEEIQGAYEANTGKVIVETFHARKITPDQIPAVLVCKHGPFIFGKNAQAAVENAVTLEEVAHMAAISRQLDAQIAPAPQYLQDKHYLRKHGSNAYYGQVKE